MWIVLTTMVTTLVIPFCKWVSRLVAEDWTTSANENLDYHIRYNCGYFLQRCDQDG